MTLSILNRRDFRAVTDCPGCGHIATHWVERPRSLDELVGLPYPTTGEERERFTRLAGLRVRLGGISLQWTTETCDAIRECRKCNHKWGEV